MSRYFALASKAELERRWNLIRNRLRERQIDALVAVGEVDTLSGMVRWLTDHGVGYRSVIVFDANELMTAIEHGGNGQVREMDGTQTGWLGIGLSVGIAAFPSIDYTAKYEAEVFCDLARKRGYRRIGLYHPNSMPYGFMATLKEGLANVEFVDETNFVDRCKAIKSPEEISILESWAARQDEVLRRAVELAQPGKLDSDLVADAFHEAGLQGGGDMGVVLGGSVPFGEPAFYRMGNQLGRTMQQGDYMNFLVEVASAGGYFVEVGRPISLGPPPSELVDLYEQAKAAQAYTFSLMKPGARAADIYAAYTDYMEGIGQQRELRLFSHGQGFDMIERPLIRWDETMELEVGMNLACHPCLMTKDGGYWLTTCDNVIIEADGPRRLHKTPMEILVA